MRKYQRMLILLISLLLVVGFLPTTAQAEETAAGKFVLVAEAGGKLVIAPEYITYTSGQTIGEALEASGHIFTGLDMGQVTAIDGVSGNFTRSDQNGGYDLTTPASSVTHYCFSERSSSESKPTEGMKQLMTAMAEYLQKSEDIQKAAKETYKNARTYFVGINNDDARTLAYELNRAVSDYENTLNGTQYTVTFSDGTKDYTGVSITAINPYGKEWVDDGDGKMQLPAGQYNFRLAHDGLAVSGTITVVQETTVTAVLPQQQWLKLDTFRLSGSYGAESHEEHKFTDAEFSLDQWEGRKLTVPVLDSFVGAIYAYAEYDKVLLTTVPSFTAVYTMQNATEDEMEKSLPFESFTSGANHVLSKGSRSNTVIYRVSNVGEGGYTYEQDYSVTFARVPTLTSITVTGMDENGNNFPQAATDAFSGAQTEYTYKILDSIKHVQVSAEPFLTEYEIVVNGQPVEKLDALDINGDTVIEITVTCNGYSNTYYLNIKPGAGQTLSVVSEKTVTVEVVNSNGVTIPYTTHKESETKNRYKYTLVPGENYSYVATYNTYYHIADTFTLEETANSTIEVDFSGMEDWLTDLAFGTKQSYKYKGTLNLETPFSTDNHSYQLPLLDTEHIAYIWVSSMEDTKIQAIYKQLFSNDVYHDKVFQMELDSGYKPGQKLNRFLMDENPFENTLTIRLSRENNGVLYYQDYEVQFKRLLTLKSLSASCDGAASVLMQENGTVGFAPQVKTYSVKVSMASMALTLDFSCYTDNLCYGEEQIGYIVKVDGKDLTDASRAVVELDGTMNTQYVTLTVENPKAPDGTASYEITILKSPPVATTFHLSPSESLLNIREVLSGERLWPDENGVFQLCEGYSYDYVLTRYGYVSKSGTLDVTRNEADALVLQDGEEQYLVTEQDNGGAVTVEWGLEKAPVNGTIDPAITSEWPDFRGNSNNNAVKDAPIPFDAEKGTLYWAMKLGDGYDADAVGSPILVDGDIITYASDKLYRVDKVTGEILATGTMDHKSSFSITPPTYAEGMIFVALSNGCVQAFNARTLQSLWIYNDPLGGQPNCPLTVKNGYLYTGFWNSETADARFVCLTITDEQPENAMESKCASWFYTAKGGFYWAGAYATDDFVLVGTDDGDNACTDRTSRMLLLDAKTGRLLDSWDNLHGDIRSSVVYNGTTNAYYFTSKGGTFYSMQVSSDLKITNTWNVELHNDTGGIPMSTCSPSVYNGRAYIGVSGSSQFGAYSGHNITVIDLGKRTIAYSVPTQGYPQTSGLLTTAYVEETGDVFVYFFDNYTPGKLRVLRDHAGQTAPNYTTKESIMLMGTEHTYDTAYALFTPTGDQAQYAICSPVVDNYGTVYFKNDSGYLMAFGSAITDVAVNNARTQYILGEKFDCTGMTVTATYANGKTRDITSNVSYNQAPLTAQDTIFTISFPYVMYHNQEDSTAMKSGVATPIPNVTIDLTIGGGLLGDVDCNGAIELEDAQMILKYEAQLLDKELIVTVSDVSGDGVIDSNDAVLIQQYLAEKFEKFPAEKSVEEPGEESQPTE